MAETKDKDYVVAKVEELGIKFIRLWFTDILGALKSFAITSDELEGALDGGMGFDGSSISGYQTIEESDMIAKPDPSTFAILPWRPKQQGVARIICDVLEPSGRPYEGDPRYVLKRNLQRAEKKGLTFYIGPELEYFYFANNECPDIIDTGGYFDLTPLDQATDLRRDTILALEEMGIRVEYSHHEVGPSQHEIDLRYTDALTMSDSVMTHRLVVKQIALLAGYYATFMPKPIIGENGSGMHTHQSLFKGKKNAFFDPNDEYHLSEIGKGFIAGQLKHVNEFCLVMSQWVNSYKRLVPGYEAPVYISWARRNRSALVRVPMYKPGNELATRAELRCPDPACNPYLTFAVMLASGLDGIEKEYDLPDPVEKDIYKMTQQQLDALGIGSLPENLGLAIKETENSELVRRALGNHVFDRFIQLKKKEWEDYRIQVSQYELERYLPVL
ncbi:MAG TPA: glutamine synthetase family protein [Candidatus Bathyarchaeia archaeon]|nr:glutamine synthetase family protein [Candidatus Bathyarchaeia archaeon]